MVGGLTAEWWSRSGASCAARQSAANSKDSNRHSICTRCCGSSARRSMERQLCLDAAGGGAAGTSSQPVPAALRWPRQLEPRLDRGGGHNIVEWRGMHSSSWMQRVLQAAGGWWAAIVAAAARNLQPSRGQSKAAPSCIIFGSNNPSTTQLLPLCTSCPLSRLPADDPLLLPLLPASRR